MFPGRAKCPEAPACRGSAGIWCRRCDRSCRYLCIWSGGSRQPLVWAFARDRGPTGSHAWPRGLEPAAVKRLLASCDPTARPWSADATSRSCCCLSRSRACAAAGEVAGPCNSTTWTGRQGGRCCSFRGKGRPAYERAAVGPTMSGRADGLSYLRRRPRAARRGRLFCAGWTAPTPGKLKPNPRSGGWFRACGVTGPGLPGVGGPPACGHNCLRPRCWRPRRHRLPRSAGKLLPPISRAEGPHAIYAKVRSHGRWRPLALGPWPGHR